MSTYCNNCEREIPYGNWNCHNCGSGWGTHTDSDTTYISENRLQKVLDKWTLERIKEIRSKRKFSSDADVVQEAIRLMQRKLNSSN